MRSSENNEVTTVAAGTGQPSSGARLRAAREAAGMSVETVASGLRIAPAQIKALEADDHTAFPAPVFFSGYVRSYARFLNLDPEPLASTLESVKPASPATRSSVAPPMQRKKRGPMLGWALLLILIIGAAAIAFVMREHRAAPASVVSEADAPTAAAEDDAQVPGALDAAALESTPPSEEAPPAPPPTDELVLRFSAVSWVEISDATGSRLVARMGAPKEEIRVQGQAPFEVLFGNARSVTLEYNGKPYTNIPVDRRGVANFRLQRPREE